MAEHDGEDMHTEAVQLRFQDENQSLDGLSVQNALTVLEGFRDLVHELYEGDALGDGPAPTVEVRPSREGSMVFDLLVQFANSHPKETFEVVSGSITTIGTAIAVGTKERRAQVRDVKDLPHDRVRLVFQDDTVVEAPAEVWQALNRRRKRTKGALYKLMKPLKSEADSLEVRSSAGDEVDPGKSPEVTATRDDAASFDLPSDPPPRVTTFEAEGRVTQINYLEMDKWRIETTHGSRQVAVLDSTFMERINKGLTVSKNDICWFKIRQTIETSKGRTTTRWEILEVEHRRRSGDEPADD